MITSYKDLIVWQKSMDLVTAIYLVTKQFPKEELYGLTSQMQRAAISIPSNIAEGSRRGTRKEYARFISTAFGSGAELEVQLELAFRLEFLPKRDFDEMNIRLQELMKMLNVMNKTLKTT